MVGGQCDCPKGTERKQIGLNAYRCVQIAPPPKCDRGWSEVDRSKAKTLRAEGWDIKQVASAGKSILCGKAPPQPRCTGGRVVRGQCECPKGTKRKQTGTNAYTCVKLPPPITCSGGTVQNGQCICPKGTQRKQTGKNAFTCQKISPTTRCDKGWSQVSRTKAKALVQQG